MEVEEKLYLSRIFDNIISPAHIYPIYSIFMKYWLWFHIFSDRGYETRFKHTSSWNFTKAKQTTLA